MPPVRCQRCKRLVATGGECLVCTGQMILCQQCLSSYRPGQPCPGCAQGRRRCTVCGCIRGVQAPCQGCAALDARRNPVPISERCKSCAQRVPPGTGYCAACSAARVPADAARREKIRAGLLSKEVRAQILEGLRGGYRLTEVVPEVGVSHQAVWGAAEVWPWWRQEVEEALMVGRPRGINHGSTRGYKRGCRCRECREAKRR